MAETSAVPLVRGNSKPHGAHEFHRFSIYHHGLKSILEGFVGGLAEYGIASLIPNTADAAVLVHQDFELT